jgi:hypothetical protein
MVGALFVLRQTTVNSNTQDSPQPRLGGSRHLPPYNILFAFPRGPHPNGFLSRDSQMGVMKSTTGTPAILRAHNFACRLRIAMRFKQSCSPHRDLFNDMSHVACTQGNRDNSWFLVVGSQISNLTLGLSFGHNLCFRCPNEQCKLILDIYALITFQWYKEFFEAMSFDPWNRVLKVWESICNSNFQHGSWLWSVRLHSLTLFGIPGSMWCDSRVFLLACNLASLCLSREPKARVATKRGEIDEKPLDFHWWT